MPLVFVHGVNVRSGKKYEKELSLRDQYFRRIFFNVMGHEPESIEIISPYWGDLATDLTAGSPFLPLKGKGGGISGAHRAAETSHGEAVSTNENGMEDQQPSLLDIAREGTLEELVDILVATASDHADDRPEHTEELAQLASRALKLNRKFQNMEDQNDWLDDVNSDSELLQKLEMELENECGEDERNSVGLKHIKAATEWLKTNYGSTAAAMNRWNLRRNQIKSGLSKIVNTARSGVKRVREARHSATSHIAAAAFTGPIRKLFHEKMFLFIGDSFLYFGQRGTREKPGPIVQRIISGLEDAWEKKQKTKDSQIIVVAHSMGGNIMADIVSYFKPEIEIDVLITVATQFPLFADLHMFPGMDTKTRPIKKPSNVKRWINFYDVNDFFGFSAQPMFEDVEDVDFASGRVGISTHADCFKFISLYERMGQAVILNP